MPSPGRSRSFRDPLRRAAQHRSGLVPCAFPWWAVCRRRRRADRHRRASSTLYRGCGAYRRIANNSRPFLPWNGYGKSRRSGANVSRAGQAKFRTNRNVARNVARGVACWDWVASLVRQRRGPPSRLEPPPKLLTVGGSTAELPRNNGRSPIWNFRPPRLHRPRAFTSNPGREVVGTAVPEVAGMPGFEPGTVRLTGVFPFGTVSRSSLPAQIWL